MSNKTGVVNTSECGLNLSRRSLYGFTGAAQVVRPVRPWPDQYSMGGIRYELTCMVCIVN